MSGELVEMVVVVAPCWADPGATEENPRRKRSKLVTDSVTESVTCCCGRKDGRKMKNPQGWIIRAASGCILYNTYYYLLCIILCIFNW